MLLENHLGLFFAIDAITGLVATGMIAFFIKETIGQVEEDFDETRAAEKKESGSIFKVLIKRPTLLIFALLLFGYNFVYAQWGFLMPTHIMSIMATGFGEFYGKLAGMNGLVVILFTPLITSVMGRMSHLGRIIVGGVLYTIGFGILGFFDMKIIFAVSILIFTLGEIMITISIMPYVADHTPASHRGRMSAIVPTIMGVGHAIGPLVMGKFVDNYSISAAWRFVGLVMLVSTFAMAGLYMKEKYKKTSIN
jgi:MFS family permease